MNISKNDFLVPLKRVFKSNDLFWQFYYGEDFAGIWKKWSSSIPSISQEEAEIIFACGAILDKDLSAFADKFPIPLDMNDFRVLLADQIASEQNIKSKGVFVQPIKIEKILVAAAVGLKCKKVNFVELGTYLGHNVRRISNLFENVYTVEASEKIYLGATKLFEFTQTRINSTFGSSLNLLNSLSVSDGNAALIFLDAHYSQGITSSRYGTCPLLDELDLIFNKFPKSVCVIDDMRTMTGLDGYPTFEDIVNFLPSGTEVVLNYDQMVLNLDPQNGYSLLGDIATLT